MNFCDHILSQVFSAFGMYLVINESVYMLWLQILKIKINIFFEFLFFAIKFLKINK